jgi:dTDP-4-amino-4,6-dideoxygalactose transaminase
MPARISVWPPLSPLIHLRRPLHDLPVPLRAPGARCYARARHGLWHGITALGLRTGDEVLVPAYHHGSEIEPYLQAGMVCRFYELTESLAPDRDELAELIGPRTRALHLTHVLGLPQDSDAWRAWCDERELLLVEDGAQAWLARSGSRPVGARADLAVFCLYKTVGVPDGAAAVCRRALPAPVRRRVGARSLAGRHALWLAQRTAAASRAPYELPAGTSYAADGEDGVGDADASPSALTLWALPRALGAETQQRRRANYLALAARLADRVPAALRDPPAGASPFALPLEVPDNAEAVERLSAAGIAAIAFWRVPHPVLEPGLFPATARRRTRIVALPVHQELRSSDLDAIADAALRVT